MYSKNLVLNYLPAKAFNVTKTNIQLNQHISFEGIKVKDLPELVIMPEASHEFVMDAIASIKAYPKALMKKVEDADFTIYLVKNIRDAFKDAFKQENISIEKKFYLENKNPTGLFGETYTLTCPKKRLIIIADKPRAKGHTDKITNHEISHALVFADELEYNSNFVKAVQKDKTNMLKIRIHHLPLNHKEMVKKYFFSSDSAESFDEIVADTIAWGCPGGGAYGSLLINKQDDAYLMRKLFPNLIKEINKYYRDSGLVYKIY